ncbi:MAG: hypothetical protein AB7F39_04805 [Variibacter sp.]
MLVAATCISPTSARDGDIPQREQNMVTHLAQATLLATRCGRLSYNDRMERQLLRKVEAKIDVEPWQSFYQRRLVDLAEVIFELLEKAACKAALQLYGPRGENVPNMILKKTR